MKEGRLKIFYGPMFSGKSAYLIKDILNNISLSKLVFKPKEDARSNKLYTREGLVFDAISIEKSDEMLNHIEDWVRIIYIDEINFFDESIINVIKKILTMGVDVVVSGLDKDFKLDWFESTKQIIDYSDISIKLKAKCHICGKKSSYTARFVDGEPASIDSPKILSDGSSDIVEYKTVCKEHHPFYHLKE